MRQIPERYDVVVAAGDLFEPAFYRRNNPYKLLEMLFPGKPVVAVLGNHEFSGGRYDEVLHYFRAASTGGDVCFLDVSGRLQLGSYNFVGNAFWYDDSMAVFSFRDDYELRHSSGSDYRFNPRRKFDKCKRQIECNYQPGRKNILVTHTCPHSELNAHLSAGHGSNAYSGCADYLERMNFRAAVCGHTHVPADARISGCEAVNVGSCREKFRYIILDAS